MKTVLARSTAGIALMASAMGTAHASEAEAIEPVDPITIAVADVLAFEEDEEEAEQQGPEAGAQVRIAPASEMPASQLPFYNAPAVPAGLLEANMAIDTRALDAAFAPVAPTMVNTQVSAKPGVVTLQSVDPYYRNIDPFYGTINPFYGDIGAFWGTINPFYGTINPFYRNINPFYGTINPFYGNIGAFWGDIDAFYGDIDAFKGNGNGLRKLGDFWDGHFAQINEVEDRFNAIQFWSGGGIKRDGAPDRMMAALATLVSDAEKQFGAAYTAETGNDFSVLVNEVFNRHGANSHTHKSAIEVMTSAQRAALFLDWHDTLNQYSGIDAIDHWMAAINWTPAITQAQGDGREAIIGIIDSSFSADADLGDNVIFSSGYAGDLGGHGAGVASLIAGAHDGEGVMGIAPNINIATHNPFDASGTTNWDDVRRGILDIQDRIWNGYNDYGWAAIMNLSLGESGYALSQGLADMFAHRDISWISSDTIFVVAAGNDGITQTTDVEWDYYTDMQFILVGSVNPAGEISSFSNRPGDACLLDYGTCHAGNELYLRTVVAPGEMLLVSDGMGGVVRRSGTSFAAPLVSGAIALMHDRWPWLTVHPDETAEIIFRSAQDLGAPGPDEVYGWGLLDVAASQSPLDFGAMQFTLYKKQSGGHVPSVMSAASLLSSGLPQWWETSEVYFTGVEYIGDTFRDFAIPASAFQRGKSSNALGRNERMQDFIQQRFARWINSGGTDRNGNGKNGGSNGKGKGKNGFSETRSNARELNGDWMLRYDAMAPRFAETGEVDMVHGAATLTDPSGQVSFTMGHGHGGMALSGYRFGIMSDHDPFTGGVNPVLGLASGESFMQLGYQLSANTKVSVGYSQNSEGWDEFYGNDPVEAAQRQAFGDRPADAFTLDIEQRVSDSVSVNAQYTRLNEVNALLGTQTATAALLGGGSKTEAMTLSASFDIGHGISFDISATGARTETSQDQLFTNSGAIWATAGQFTASKQGILSGRDSLRLSVAQPLQVERGALQVTTDEVINRETGEIGPVTQTFSIATERRITGEAVYATPLTNSSEFGVFGRYTSAGDTADEAGFVVGGNFSLRF